MAVMRRYTSTLLGAGLLLLSLPGAGTAQHLTPLADVATGEGTVSFHNGDKQLINAVALFFRENGEAQIWLMTRSGNLYAGGRWFRRGPANQTIDLEITDDTDGGSATGCGVVSLQEGCVRVARLTIIMSRANGTGFEADFVEKNPRPCLINEPSPFNGEQVSAAEVGFAVAHLKLSSRDGRKITAPLLCRFSPVSFYSITSN